MKSIDKAWFCQIELTSRCFMSCLYCSRYNRHLRADQRYDMTVEVLEKALDSLKGWPTRIGIIGGEPLLHDQFEECCALIQSKFPRQKMGLWTSGGKNWPRYKELAEKTFGFLAYNKHTPEQKKVCRHQRLTVAVKDVVKDEEYMNELIDDCWVQRTWCPTISMKGAFFCEVAAAQDLLWDGPGGYPIEPNWWRKTPEEFKDQRDRYCQNCGMCIPMERDLIQCGVEKMSPSVYANMQEHYNLGVNPGEHIEIYDKQMSIDEIEANKLTWYPGNYRGDNHEDHRSPEGRGSTVFRKPAGGPRSNGLQKAAKTELMTMWYNEEFLAPFFLRHYRFVDKIHIFLDADTNDGTKNEIDRACAFHNNIHIHMFKFPDKMDDIIKILIFNEFYKTLDTDYVFLVDSDEFIFYPPGYLEAHPDIVHFTKLWNVYRHHTEQDLNPELPIREQRRYGVSDFEGQDIYTKPNIVKAKQDFRWGPGHHFGHLNGQLVDWRARDKNFPPGVSRMDALPGAHWSMADPAFVIERRIKGRKERQSQNNLKHGLTRQHHDITEEVIRASLKQHENDPQVLYGLAELELVVKERDAELQTIKSSRAFRLNEDLDKMTNEVQELRKQVDAFRASMGWRVLPKNGETGTEMPPNAEKEIAKTLHAQAILLECLGRRELSIRQLGLALELERDNPEFFNDAGVLYYKDGDQEKGLACLRKANELQPGNPEMLRNLGVVLLAAGLYKEAVDTYISITNILPDDIDALTVLGNLSVQYGQDQSALLFFKKVLALDAGNASANAYLGSRQIAGPAKDAGEGLEYAVTLDQSGLGAATEEETPAVCAGPA